MVAAIAAIPVVGSFSTAVGVSAATVASIGVYGATTAASYFLNQALGPETKQEFGTKLKAVLGGAVNQSIIFGQKETAGSFIYKGSWGRANSVPNAFLVKVYALSDLPVNGFLSTIWAGGRKCSIDTSTNDTIDGVVVGHPVPAFNRNGIRLWVKFYDGTQTAADPYLRAKFGSDDRAWTSDMVGRGRAYAILTQKYDKKEPVGEVDPVFVISGARLYDWRQDSSNGGSGPHRYGTYSTYAYNSDNPIVALRNVMQGIYWDGEWLYGGQAWSHMRFDNDSFTAAANVCDEDVALAAGGTQKRYRVGGEIDLSEEPWTVIERLLKACNGRMVETGGVFKVYAGGIGASVLSFSDDDVLVSESLSARYFPGREDVANTVVGSYVEPDNAGEAKAFKARTNTSYLAEDGGEVRKISFDLDYVRDNRRAQRLSKLALNDNRRFRTFVVAFWTGARMLEPCDVVSWTSARFGFSNKKFIVGDVTLRDDGVVIANMREADAADADWSTGDEAAYEVGIFDVIETPSQVLTATVTAVAITDDDNMTALVPAVRIQATLTDDFVDCEALLWQVRKRNGDRKIIARGRSESFFDPDSADYGDITFSDAAFKGGKQVQVRYMIDPESGRPTEWSDDWTTTTSYITFGGGGRLKIENLLTEAANDIDAVISANIKLNSVQTLDSFSWSDSDSKGVKGTIPASGFRSIGSVPIENPNDSAVVIELSITNLYVYAVVSGVTNVEDTSAIILYELRGYGTGDGPNSGNVVASGSIDVTDRFRQGESGESNSKTRKEIITDMNPSINSNRKTTYEMFVQYRQIGDGSTEFSISGRAKLLWWKR